MYERSAIVLERYIEKIFGFDKANNLRSNYKNFGELLEEVKQYKELTEKEGKIIKEFDDTVKEIESIQAKQGKICEQNQKLEQNRNQLFMDLGEDSKILDNKFKKTENAIEENNKYLKELREDFINYLSDFSNRQKERNKCEKARRIGESNHLSYIKKMQAEFQGINFKDVITLKDFINSDKTSIKQELNEVMTKNGKNEKIGFNQDVLKMAIKARISIAEKEAECYVLIYDKMKKILAELENDNLKLNKYEKHLKDVSVKLAFLEAEKEYIFGFLDYERMTTIAGIKAHKKKMEEACQNFELDMIQIHNLYELILREISNKSTKKAYKELYNKTYLKSIEDKEKNFEEEVNNIKINIGTVINSNYWRIEGIKNVYNVFQEEVTEKFNKDLSEFKLEESVIEQDNPLIENKSNDRNKAKTENKEEEKIDYDDEEYEDYEDYDDDEYYDDEEDEYYYDDEDYDEDDEDEYDDNDYEDDKFYEDEEEYDEYEDDEEYLEEDEYDNEYEEEDYEEDDDEYYDDEDEYNDDYFEDEEDEPEDEDEEDYVKNEKENKKTNKKTTNKRNNKKKQNMKDEAKEIDDDAWEKEIIQQLNKKRTAKNTSKKQNTNLFGKLFKDKKENNKRKK